MDHAEQTPVAAPFTQAELDSLHVQDFAAARAVVVLMCSIFMIGVLIYSVVAIVVSLPAKHV